MVRCSCVFSRIQGQAAFHAEHVSEASGRFYRECDDHTPAAPIAVFVREFAAQIPARRAVDEFQTRVGGCARVEARREARPLVTDFEADGVIHDIQGDLYSSCSLAL